MPAVAALATNFVGMTKLIYKTSQCRSAFVGDAKRHSEIQKQRALAQRREATLRRKTGHAYFVRFPFTLHSVRADITPYEIAIDGKRVRFYWPYVSGGDNAPKQPQAEWVGAPVPPGTTPIDDIWPKLAAKTFPNYKDDKREYLQADSLRLDIYPVPNADELEELVNRFVGLTRWWTQQWWIGRDDRNRVSPAGTALAINDRGEIAGTTFNAVNLSPFYGYERLLDARAFHGVCYALQRGISIPYAYSVMFDASYYQAIGDHERFVMAISIACDAMIIHAAQRLADKSKVDTKVYERRLDSQDQLYNLDRGLADIVGVSFKSTEYDAYSALSLVWQARGRVAHGKSPTISDGGVQRRLTGDERIAAINAIGRLAQLLEERAGTPGAYPEPRDGSA